jgi:hypothetical protein
VQCEGVLAAKDGTAAGLGQVQKQIASFLIYHAFCIRCH